MVLRADFVDSALTERERVAKRFVALPKDRQLRYISIAEPHVLSELYASLNEWRGRPAMADAILRPEQIIPIPPGRHVLVKGGRGGGKSLTAARHLKRCAEIVRGLQVAAIGPQLDHCRVEMFEKHLASVFPASLRRDAAWTDSFNRSTVELFLADGGIIRGYSAEPRGRQKLRGPNTHVVWADEFGVYSDRSMDPDKEPDCTMSLAFKGCRVPSSVGAHVLWTSTPRTCTLMRWIMERAGHKVTLRTADNLDNLDADFATEIMLLAGTRIGRQELEGEMIEEVEGALLRAVDLDKFRVSIEDAQQVARYHSVTLAELYQTRVLSIDPSGSDSDKADECGMIIKGLTTERSTPSIQWPGGIIHALADYSKVMAPNTQAELARELVAEGGLAGVLLEQNMIATREVMKVVCPEVQRWDISVKGSKWDRATPIASRYLAGQSRIVGSLPDLETQWSTWRPAPEGSKEARKSPDRVDADVNGDTWLRRTRGQAGGGGGAVIL